MAKVLKSYYGWNYNEADNAKSETSVEVLLSDGNKYNGEFSGVNHARTAISFVNSVLQLAGKTEILYCKMSTRFYTWVEEEEKVE